MMRLSILLILVICLSGCYQQPPAPTLRPIAKISARVHAVQELGLSATDFVEVPQEHMPAFAILITPTEPCVQQIKSNMHHHVADVIIRHKDGSTTTLLVRWTGHGPAAISLDDRNYYYGGSDNFPDGAIRIVRLLNEYSNQSSKTIE